MPISKGRSFERELVNLNDGETAEKIKSNLIQVLSTMGLQITH